MPLTWFNINLVHHSFNFLSILSIRLLLNMNKFITLDQLLHNFYFFIHLKPKLSQVAKLGSCEQLCIPDLSRAIEFLRILSDKVKVLIIPVFFFPDLKFNCLNFRGLQIFISDVSEL